MIFKNDGTNLKKNMKTKLWWMKLGLALILSNIFFFVLFSGDDKKMAESSIPDGWVELQVKGDLLTSFLKGKRVLLVSRLARKQVEAILHAPAAEIEGRITVLVRETEAPILFKHEQWETLPFIKTLSFNPVIQGEGHEIRY